MSESFKSPAEAIANLRDLIEERHRSPLGALFTTALIREHGQETFLTGRIVLLDSEPLARGRVAYDNLTLLEEWVSPVGVAIDRLTSLMEGGAPIAGQHVVTNLKFWRGDWRPDYYEKISDWSEWVLEAQWDPNGNRPSPPNEPIVGFGLPPFASGRDALTEWVWGRRLRASETPHLNKLLIVLPDTRGRILAADWTKEHEVRVELETHVLPEELELQVLFVGSLAERHRLVRAPGKVEEMQVPKDTEAIWFCLVHASGKRLGQTSLSASNRKVDVRVERLPLEAQAEEDLHGGESDEVEFKPFIEPKHQKERELVETVVAFANTRGGRLYLGLDDHRGVQGSAELKRIYKAQEELARDNLQKYLRKLIGDKVRPVPKFSPAFVEHRGEPVAVVTVERGEYPPYATDNDEVFVRKGSSNVRPDPLTELPDLCRRRQGPITIPTTLLIGGR